MTRSLVVFHHRHTINTTVKHGRTWKSLDSDQRAQLAADLLSLPQPAMGQAQALMLARWLIEVEVRRGDEEFAAAVARRMVE